MFSEARKRLKNLQGSAVPTVSSLKRTSNTASQPKKRQKIEPHAADKKEVGHSMAVGDQHSAIPDVSSRHTESNKKQSDNERLIRFGGNLSKLASCASFDELNKTCSSLYGTLPDDIDVKTRHILPDLKTCDQGTMDMIPHDIPNCKRDDLVPIMVGADGDCLPRSASVFASGNEHLNSEIRARLVLELVQHKDKYLSPEHLRLGTNLTDRQALKLPSKYAMISDVYIPGKRLTDKDIEHIYDQEVQSISQARTFMGIWQLFAVASILKCKLYSVYPKLGNPGIRSDLHRRIYPRDDTNTTDKKVTIHTDCDIHILWTTTRPEYLRN